MRHLYVEMTQAKETQRKNAAAQRRTDHKCLRVGYSTRNFPELFPLSATTIQSAELTAFCGGALNFRIRTCKTLRVSGGLICTRHPDSIARIFLKFTISYPNNADPMGEMIIKILSKLSSSSRRGKLAFISAVKLSL